MTKEGGFAVSCNVDWNLIRTEYISGDISYRKLAEKYGLSRRTVEDKAKVENWYKQKQAVRGKSVAKTVELLSDVEAEKALRIIDVADELLNRVYEQAREDLSPKEIRSLASALKTIKETKGIKTALEIREQEARIANLEKQVEKDNSDDTIEVVMDAFEEYSV